MLGAPGAEPLLGFLGANTSEMSPRQGLQLPAVLGSARARQRVASLGTSRALVGSQSRGAAPAPQHHHPQLGFEAEEDVQGVKASPLEEPTPLLSKHWIEMNVSIQRNYPLEERLESERQKEMKQQSFQLWGEGSYKAKRRTKQCPGAAPRLKEEAPHVTPSQICGAAELCPQH